MRRPLYNSLAENNDLKLEGHNAGLWYDKYCNRWLSDDKGQWSLGDRKKEWIDETAKKLCGDEKLLTQSWKRLMSLVDRVGGEAREFSTVWRFASGLGRSHPVENGFAWHHTLGVPFLPGSSVKGLVRAYADQWLDQKPDDKEMQRIFGPRDQGQAAAGSVIFFDALPTEPVKLEADVMTPHYNPYYQGDEPKPPADWHSPIPIPFLTIAKGRHFLFAVAPRNPAAKADSMQVMTWLEKALDELGAGAKTAVGYGRFSLVAESKRLAEWRKEEERKRTECEQKRRLEAAIRGLSPLAAAFETQALSENWDNDKNKFSANNVIEGWLDRIEKSADQDGAVDAQIVKRLAMLVEKHFEKLLANPAATQGKKSKLCFSERQQKFANRLIVLRNRSASWPA